MDAISSASGRYPVDYARSGRLIDVGTPTKLDDATIGWLKAVAGLGNGEPPVPDSRAGLKAPFGTADAASAGASTSSPGASAGAAAGQPPVARAPESSQSDSSANGDVRETTASVADSPSELTSKMRALMARFTGLASGQVAQPSTDTTV